MIHCILFDDDSDFISKFKHFAAQEKGFKLCLVTSSAYTIQDYLSSNTIVDVCIFDIEMQGVDNLLFCEELKNKYPNLKLLLATALQNARSINKIMACGAHGFYSKNSEIGTLKHGIESVFHQSYYSDKSTKTFLQEAMKVLSEENHTTPASSSVKFTLREKEVLKLICRQYNTFEIANRLQVSSRTIEAHRKNILVKTNSRNFNGAILFALKHKLISINEI